MDVSVVAEATRPETSPDDITTAPVLPATLVTGKEIAVLVIPVTCPVAFVVITGTYVAFAYVPAEPADAWDIDNVPADIDAEIGVVGVTARTTLVPVSNTPVE